MHDVLTRTCLLAVGYTTLSGLVCSPCPCSKAASSPDATLSPVTKFPCAERGEGVVHQEPDSPPSPICPIVTMASSNRFTRSCCYCKINEQDPQLNRVGARRGALIVIRITEPNRKKTDLLLSWQGLAHEETLTLCLGQPSHRPFPLCKSLLLPCCAGTCTSLP